MISTYKYGYGSKFPDLMSSFSGFSPLVWVIMLVLGVVFTAAKYQSHHLLTRELAEIRDAVREIRFLVRVKMAELEDVVTIMKQRHMIRMWRKMIEYKSHPQPDEMLLLTRFLQFFDYPDSLIRNSIAIAAFSFFALFTSFYLRFFYSSLINTSAVVIDKPDTIESYDDVVASSMRPVWILSADQSPEFSGASIGSSAYRIWQKACKMGINDSILAYPDWKQVIRGNAVWFAPSLYAYGIMTRACALNRDHRIAPRYPLRRSDASAREVLFSHMRSGFMDQRTSSRVDRAYRQVFEAGLTEMLISQLHHYFKTTAQESQTCQSNQLIYPDQDVPAITLTHCKTLILACISLFTMCASLFWYERMFSMAVNEWPSSCI